jgi:TATA-box binding protein (TBP) (component of TFIID and TFIIIB)
MNELIFPEFQVFIVVPYIVDPTLLTVKVIIDNRQPRIKLFQSGKVNVLGMPSYSHIQQIYEFMNELYSKNTDILTYIPLQKD